MSKLAIFLCAVLCASAVHASYWSSAVETVQQKVESVITASINKVKQEYEAAKEKALELAAKLEEAALSFSEKVYDQIKAVLDKSQDEIDKLTGKANGVDVTECNKLAAHLDYTALAVISNMSSCVVDKLETGGGYVESIIKVSEDVLANLTAIKDEAYHCGDNVDGITSAAGAIVCANLAAAKATWAATKSVPALTIQLTKLTYLLTTLQPSLAYCSTTNGLIAFYHESSTIVERTKQCIQQKIDEVGGVTPEVEYTTPEVEYSTPEGEYSTPEGEYSTPEGEYSTPEGEYSTPEAEHSTPEAEYTTEEVHNETSESTYPSEEVTDNVAQE